MAAPSANQANPDRPSVYGDTFIYGSAPVHMGDVYKMESTSTDGIGEDKKRTKTAFLRSLSFSEMDYRFHNVDDPISNTCDWFLNHKFYQEWKATSSSAPSDRLMWLRGKPGSGKSTIMKRAIIQARAEQNTHRSRSSRAGLVICFFFNTRGSRLEMITQGFFQSLLLQIFEHEDLALEDDPLKTFVRKHALLADGWEWTVGELQTLFRSIVARLPVDLVLYIDALDECDSATNRGLVDFLYEYLENFSQNNVSLKICISSRHYPNIHKLDCRTVIVEEHNSLDILTYTKAKLLNIGIDSVTPQQITMQSSGIFLWAVLVIGKLRDAIADGEPRSSLLKLLSSVPKDLKKLFESILASIVEDEEREQSILLLLSVLGAKRPFTLRQLNLMLAFTTQHQSQAEYRQSLGFVSDDQLGRLIVKRSRGLIEIVSSRYGSNIVQFLHTSVKDFLLENSRTLFPQAQSGKAILAFANDQLARSCFNFLRTGDLFDKEPGNQLCRSHHSQRPNHTYHPLTHYLFEHAFEHAREAETAGISQRHVAEALILNSSQYAHLGKLPFQFEVTLWQRQELAYRSLMTLCSYHQMLSVFEALPQPVPSNMIQNLCLDDALGVAIVMGHEAIINALVSKAVCLSTSCRLLLYKAVKYAETDTVELLLRFGVDPNAQGEYGSTLNHAVFLGKDEHVRTLLNYNARMCFNDHVYGHALLISTVSGHSHIVQTLLDHGADVALRGKCYWGYNKYKSTHALKEASYHGYTTILSSLLQAADRQCIDEQYYHDAYLAATTKSSAGHIECVALIKAAAEIRAFTGSSAGPCHFSDITVHVKTLHRGSIDVVVSEDTQGIGLRQAISKYTGAHSSNRWILNQDNWRSITDAQRLCDIGVVNGSTVHETLAFRAGTVWVDNHYDIERVLRLSREQARLQRSIPSRFSVKDADAL